MRLWRSLQRKLEGFFRNWWASSENRKISLKTQNASSEERWVRTHISFRNTVQLRLRIFWSCVSCVFWSCICVFRAVFVTAKQNSNEKVYAKTYTVAFQQSTNINFHTYLGSAHMPALFM